MIFCLKKLEFDNTIKNEGYDCLISVVWEFDTEINFAACGYYSPVTDLEENIIQNLEKDKVVSYIYFNVFPESGRSIALLSQLKSDGEKLLNLQNQLQSLSEKERQYYITNIVMDNTDNIVINPTPWENLSTDKKEVFGMHELRMLCEEENRVVSMVEKPEMNLFEL